MQDGIGFLRRVVVRYVSRGVGEGMGNFEVCVLVWNADAAF